MKMIQILILVLDDGRRFNFTIPAVLTEKDRLKEVFITKPKPLPKGCSWETLTSVTSESQ